MSGRFGAGWLVAGLLMFSAVAVAQPGSGPWGGHPMMGGSGPGPYHDGGYGRSWGGGYGSCMGPGMMGGMGPGGLDMGPGMGGHLWALDLTEKQIDAISDITNQQRKTQWKAMSAMMQARQELQRLYAADEVDTDAVVQVYDRIHEQQRAMTRSMLEARNRVMAQLTDEQKQQLRQRFRGPWGQQRQPQPQQSN